MYILLYLLFINNRVVDGTSNIAKDIIDYFDDANIRSFADKWELYRTPIENAIELVLKETFGKAGLKVLVGNDEDALKVSDGFLVDDNIVHVLFQDMYLSRLPGLENPRVIFSLPSNVLRVEASVSKMFVETKYLLFRNISDVVYSNKEAASTTSPFTLQQVQNKGQATIIAEHCNLAGFILATLQGESVNLGQDNFKLNNCKFSVEISTSGLGSPPLIAPYFAQKLGFQLENILTKPIQAELTSKLKDAILSYVNISSTLGNLLPNFRNIQQNLFKKTTSYMTEVIKYFNMLTAEANAASEEMEDMEITWTDEYEGKSQMSLISLTNMTVSGLDTMYSACTGGAYKFGSIKIDDATRFSGLQVRGSGLLKVHDAENFFIFSSEVQDFISYITLRVNLVDHMDDEGKHTLKASKETLKFETRGWRSLNINGPNSPLVNTYSLITGFLLNRIPETVVRHLAKYFDEAVRKVETPNDEGTNHHLTDGSDKVVGDGKSDPSLAAEEQTMENISTSKEQGSIEDVSSDSKTKKQSIESLENSQNQDLNKEEHLSGEKASGTEEDISNSEDLNSVQKLDEFSDHPQNEDTNDGELVSNENNGTNHLKEFDHIQNETVNETEEVLSGNEQNVDSGHHDDFGQSVKNIQEQLSIEDSTEHRILSEGLFSNKKEKQFDKLMYPNRYFYSSNEKENEEEMFGVSRQKLQDEEDNSSDIQSRKFVKGTKLRKVYFKNAHTSDNEIRPE